MPPLLLLELLLLQLAARLLARSQVIPSCRPPGLARCPFLPRRPRPSPPLRAVRQVGANMNKQAFKRYLQTMSWNENETVRGRRRGQRAGAVGCKLRMRGCGGNPWWTLPRGTAVSPWPPAHVVQHPPLIQHSLPTPANPPPLPTPPPNAPKCIRWLTLVTCPTCTVMHMKPPCAPSWQPQSRLSSPGGATRPSRRRVWVAGWAAAADGLVPWRRGGGAGLGGVPVRHG